MKNEQKTCVGYFSLVNFGLFLFFQLVIYQTAIAQGCTPAVTTFTNQAQIDAFLINYPNCQVINGDIEIQENSPGSITNLNGFIQIKKVNGFLKILNNTNLGSLNGLISLEHVTGDLKIQNNPAIQNLNPLINIDSIGGNLRIMNNNGITNLVGIDSIKWVGEWIYINENASLKNLVGFPPFKDFDGRLRVASNPSLTSLIGLDSLEAIRGLWIYDNDSLTTLQHLNNLHTIYSFLEIVNNLRLATYSGLDSLNYVGWFLRLENDDELTSLEGLGSVNYIGGYLKIKLNDKLQDLTGFGPVSSFPGHLYINDNPSLKTLDGLQNITNTGRDLEIARNDSLTDISALLSLTSIDGHILVENNPMLTSLYGLDNIDPSTITDLILTDCDSLSFCNVQSICDYLDIPTNQSSISGTAPGCLTTTEILNACLSGLTTAAQKNVSIYPVPTHDILFFDGLPDEPCTYKITDLSGKVVFNETNDYNSIHIDKLQVGAYFITISSKNIIVNKRFVKVN